MAVSSPAAATTQRALPTCRTLWPLRRAGRDDGDVIGPGDARLLPSDDIGQAAWIRERLVGFGAGVQSVVPTGFPAYVRLLHPAERPPPEPRLIRWAEVAQRAGVTMHAAIDFDELAAALDGLAPSKRWEVAEPHIGNLDPEPLAPSATSSPATPPPGGVLVRSMGRVRVRPALMVILG